MKKEYAPPTREELTELIGENAVSLWEELCSRIDALYDMERQWNSGGKRWEHEYKYRRGGKTLCALYAREKCSGFMVILGKDEREKFEALRGEFSDEVCTFYDEATTYHDGKWIMFSIDEKLFDDYIRLLSIKRKPNKI